MVMALSVNHVCTICEKNRISKRAVTWCIECEVLFCKDCKKDHSKSRLSNNHKTMSAEDYHNLPACMQESGSKCRDHEKKYELYCSFHACPCCVQCITDEHKKCQDLKSLSDILKQVKSSASVQLFEKDLKVVKENLDAAKTYMKTRISTIKIQKSKAVEEIKYMRKSINDYLNKLEQDILNDLESKHSRLKLDMATLLQHIDRRESQINRMQSQFIKMRQYATELQMYIGLREIEKTTSQTAKYIDDLESGDRFSEKNLEVNISSALQSILKDVKSFGDIAINTNSFTLQIKTGRKDQAQNLIPKFPEIEQIKPSLLTRMTIPKDMRMINIMACLILPDNTFILLDDNKCQLLLFSNDGFFIRIVVTFKGYPVDVCFVRNNTVAVALETENQTTLVNIEKNTIIETIELSHFCCGVASDGNILVNLSNDSRWTTVNLNDMSHTIIEGMEGVDNISLFQGYIYVTNSAKSTVCCFKSTGEPIWSFQRQDIDWPYGISSDVNEFVYIASFKNNSVVVVSPDDKTCKTILSEADGINDPYGLHINKETGMMIVSSKTRENSKIEYETAFIYKI